MSERVAPERVAPAIAADDFAPWAALHGGQRPYRLGDAVYWLTAAAAATFAARLGDRQLEPIGPAAELPPERLT